MLSATLTHDPEPLKRFRLNFPRLFLASNIPREFIGIGTFQEENNKRSLPSVQCHDFSLQEKINHSSKMRVTRSSENLGGVGIFSTPSGLKEFFVELTHRQKPLFLAYLIKAMKQEKILCFTNSRETTKRLAILMSNFDGINAGALNAGMPLQKRTRLLSSFACGDFQVHLMISFIPCWSGCFYRFLLSYEA